MLPLSRVHGLQQLLGAPNSNVGDKEGLETLTPSQCRCVGSLAKWSEFPWGCKDLLPESRTSAIANFQLEGAAQRVY